MREKVSLNVVNDASVLALRYEHNPEKKFHEILVPTADTERCQWLLKLMLGIKKPVILVGETGTAKTATIQSFLRTIEGDNNVSLIVVIVVIVNVVVVVVVVASVSRAQLSQEDEQRA